MQFTKATLLAVVATLVSAQLPDLSGLPSCALAPAVGALGSTGCGLSDFKCICSATSFLTSLQSAITTACSAADLAKAETFAYNLCLSAGVTLSIPGTASSTSAAPASTSEAPATSAAPESSTESVAESSSMAPVPTTSAYLTKASPSAGGPSTVYVTVCAASSSLPVPVVSSTVPVTKPSTTVVPVKSNSTTTAPGVLFTGAASSNRGSWVVGGLMAAGAAMLL